MKTQCIITLIFSLPETKSFYINRNPYNWSKTNKPFANALKNPSKILPSFGNSNNQFGNFYKYMDKDSETLFSKNNEISKHSDDYLKQAFPCVDQRSFMYCNSFRLWCDNRVVREGCARTCNVEEKCGRKVEEEEVIQPVEVAIDNLADELINQFIVASENGEIPETLSTNAIQIIKDHENNQMDIPSYITLEPVYSTELQPEILSERPAELHEVGITPVEEENETNGDNLVNDSQVKSPTPEELVETLEKIVDDNNSEGLEKFNNQIQQAPLRLSLDEINNMMSQFDSREEAEAFQREMLGEHAMNFLD